jgi:hypothetical protein
MHLVALVLEVNGKISAESHGVFHYTALTGGNPLACHVSEKLGVALIQKFEMRFQMGNVEG